MKRFLAFVLVCALLLCCTACTGKKETLTKPVAFYYCTTEVVYDGKTGIIAAEQRESSQFGDDMTALLNAYLQGPISESFQSPFPENVQIVTFSMSGPTILAVLSKEFSQLSGLDLIIACACLSRTIFDLAEQNCIQIAAFDSQLDGQTYITIDRDSMFLVDDPTEVTAADETETS